jgi:hypothetical protein
MTKTKPKKKLRLKVVPTFAKCKTWEQFAIRLMELKEDLDKLVNYVPGPMLPEIRRRLRRAGHELYNASTGMETFHRKRQLEKEKREVALCLLEQRRKGIPELVGHLPKRLRDVRSGPTA